MARRYLGYGTTNSQGIATLDHDPNGNPISGYTGVGAGLVDIVATSGELQSEIYVLWDTIFYDTMKPYDSNKWSTTLSVAQETGGLEITESSNTSTNFSSTFSAIEEVVIEFDLLGKTVPNNSVRFRYKGTDNYISAYISDLAQHHFKFVVTNGTLSIYVDDVFKSSKSTSSGTGCAFTLNGSSVLLSDFKIYNY